MIYDEGRAKSDGVELPVQCLLMNLSKELSAFALPHYHDYIEILYILKGKFRLFTDKEYTCDAGDMAVINSKEAHNVLPDGTDCTYIVVKFLPQILYTSEQTLFEIKYMLPFTLSGSPHPHVIKKEEFNDTEIPYIMNRMMQEWQTRDYAYELAIRADILHLFSWILRYWNSLNLNLEDYSVKPELARVVQPSLEYASKNFANADARTAANECALSYSYFCRSFKSVTKKSFSEYLTYLKLSEAEKLLITTDLSMTEIAHTCGFSTSSYFIQQFKKQKKMSPRQFRITYTTKH